MENLKLIKKLVLQIRALNKQNFPIVILNLFLLNIIWLHFLCTTTRVHYRNKNENKLTYFRNKAFSKGIKIS